MATNPSTMRMAVLLLCCLCGALGQKAANATGKLQAAWQATMAAPSVKVTRKLSTSTTMPKLKDMEPVEQITTTTLHLRKSGESVGTDMYAIVKMEGVRDLEAEVVVLGMDVYTLFKSGVAEESIGEWYNSDDLDVLNLVKDYEGFSGTFVLTAISDLLKEENIQRVSTADGDGDCYDVVPTKAYTDSLGKSGSKLALTHLVCIDAKTGYVISSTIEDTLKGKAGVVDDDKVVEAEIVVAEKYDTSFSDFGEYVSFPDAAGYVAKRPDSPGSILRSSKDVVKISISAVLAAALLALLL